MSKECQLFFDLTLPGLCQQWMLLLFPHHFLPNTRISIISIYKCLSGPTMLPISGAQSQGRCHQPPFRFMGSLSQPRSTGSLCWTRRCWWQGTPPTASSKLPLLPSPARACPTIFPSPFMILMGRSRPNKKIKRLVNRAVKCAHLKRTNEIEQTATRCVVASFLHSCDSALSPCVIRRVGTCLHLHLSRCLGLLDKTAGYGSAKTVCWKKVQWPSYQSYSQKW